MSEIISQLSNKFRPKCLLHKDEIYFPTTIQNYVELMSVHKMKDGKNTSPDDPIIDLDLFSPNTPIEMSTQDLYLKPKNYEYKKSSTSNLLDLAPLGTKSAFIGNPTLDKTPYYVMFHDDTTDPLVKHISYTFFYAFNGSTDILFNTVKIEDHFSDCEHITVTVEPIDRTANLTSPENYKIKQVYYAAHSGGSVITPDNLKTVNDNGLNPIVYTAVHTHASYTSPGTYFRIFGFGNDQTSDGYEWFPNTEVIAVNGKGVGDYVRFYSYKGTLGFKGDLPFSGKSHGDKSVASLSTKGWAGNTGVYEKDHPSVPNIGLMGYKVGIIVMHAILIGLLIDGLLNNKRGQSMTAGVGLFYLMLIVKYKLSQAVLMLIFVTLAVNTLKTNENVLSTYKRTLKRI